MVLDIETRIDAGALRATRRTSAPKGMPSGLQGIAAAALLEFTMDDRGVCDDFRLTAADRAGGGERAIVAMAERKLAGLAADDGTLVTFNGSHDLGILRLAAVRQRQFDHAAAAGWLRDGGDRHDDLMLELESGPRAWPRLDDIAAKLGIVSNSEFFLGDVATSAERMKCELDVVVTLALYMHIMSERMKSVDPLLHGMTRLAGFVSDRLPKAPHFQAAMRAPAFVAAAGH
ncbi:hypothetical protein [Sphingomonas sp.]|jgi:hypothetical protein|uniref:hypothetical protein n=1 Tax=Sphingomonas sp. TaxID=28214 RepID=UPI002E3776CC|nr:hypothetical protein [Sphingomonas sp.]HEX4694455.1 hypothetical protein [Sphingomonas sp.]